MKQRTPRFLVTAGSTRERIDEVRDWGNIFTGNTGFDIASALARLGHVDLLTSNQSHLDRLATDQALGRAIQGACFRTHADLKAALERVMTDHCYDAVFMTAAVSDYAPEGSYQVIDRRIDPATGRQMWIVENVQAGKVKSHYPSIAFLGRRTEKLIDLFRTRWNYRGLLVKFKLEVGIDGEALLKIARASRRASDADHLVANTLDMVQGARPGAYLVSEAAEEWVDRTSLPARLARLVATHCGLNEFADAAVGT